MERLLKCCGWCDEKYTKKNLTRYNKKNYCNDCLEIKKYDDIGQTKLYEQIRESFKIDEPTVLMLRDSKNYREKQGYTYQDQAKAIWYADVVLKIDLDKKFNLGIIVNVIEDAVEFYAEQKARIEAEKIKDQEEEDQQEEIEIEEDQQEDQKNIKKQRLLKCYGWCNEKHPKEELTKYNSKNYCKKCLARKKLDDLEKVILHNQIRKSFGIEYPTLYMLKESKEYREKQGFSYKDQAKAIKYVDEVKEMEMDIKFGLSSIQFNLQTAVKYYADQKEKEEKLPDYIVPAKPRTVQINMPYHKEYVPLRLVDMDSLLD